MNRSIHSGELGSRTALDRRSWLWVGFVALWFGLAAQIASGLASAGSWWLHSAWCIAGLALATPLLFRAIKRGFKVVLKDHLVMFTGSFVFYFLIGALFLPFGPEEEKGRVLAYYPVDATLALRADSVNAFGFGIAVIVAAVAPRGWLGRQCDRVAVFASRVPAPSVMLLLLVFSVTALSQTWAVDFGFREGPISGVWRTLARLSTVAIFLGASYRGRHETKLRGGAAMLALAGVASGLMLFSKTEVLVSLGALVAGLAVRFGVRRVLPAGLTVLLFLYFALGGVIAFGRTAIPFGTPAGVAERWAALLDGASAGLAGEDAARTSSWGRICYLPAQAAGLELYDMGLSGDEVRLIPWVFVPRALMPSKPVITQSGKELHRKISGSESSQTGQGIFTSAYYNGGWLVLVLASMLCGFLLAQTSAIAAPILERNALLLLPLALSGFYMAFRIDGSFVADYLGAFVFVLYPMLAASVLLAFHERWRAKR